jgi:hypothetical protein
VGTTQCATLGPVLPGDDKQSEHAIASICLHADQHAVHLTERPRRAAALALAHLPHRCTAGIGLCTLLGSLCRPLASAPGPWPCHLPMWPGMHLRCMPLG